MLTDKARTDFVEYHYNQVNFAEESHEDHWKLFLDTTEEIHQQASVIDWLDSVDVFTEVTICHSYSDYHNEELFRGSICSQKYKCWWDDERVYNTREEASKAAIEKANELYNGQAQH